MDNLTNIENGKRWDRSRAKKGNKQTILGLSMHDDNHHNPSKYFIFNQYFIHGHE
ncbi:hypothetical protein DFA_07350 [Cavenderia fasciculata]|uniref:Uncharacterized protein n=1 Tax=Cavenderia fasciculata TaxID=261658 RepID=F4PW65_CACFS|nr:uncharacterized protein DFA_07350 [Cavenderia fasciculata]EGG20229.1 hypothetical protein DFA_07350 [Cavenderia fasciculata]|eukprot:XP_004367212.1 hypothetical protein DFA_07350 [Cavenderia fasciculata]